MANTVHSDIRGIIKIRVTCGKKLYRLKNGGQRNARIWGRTPTVKSRIIGMMPGRTINLITFFTSIFMVLFPNLIHSGASLARERPRPAEDCGPTPALFSTMPSADPAIFPAARRNPTYKLLSNSSTTDSGVLNRTGLGHLRVREGLDTAACPAKDALRHAVNHLERSNAHHIQDNRIDYGEEFVYDMAFEHRVARTKQTGGFGKSSKPVRLVTIRSNMS